MISYNEFFKTNNLTVKAETLGVLLDPKYLIFFDNLENKESLILDIYDQRKLLLINILISVMIKKINKNDQLLDFEKEIFKTVLKDEINYKTEFENHSVVFFRDYVVDGIFYPPKNDVDLSIMIGGMVSPLFIASLILATCFRSFTALLPLMSWRLLEDSIP